MHSTINNSIRKLLETTHVSDMKGIQKQELIQFEEDNLIRDVFETLSEKSIYSAPVHSALKKKYVGMVDLRDFVSFVLSIHMKGEPIIFTADKITDFSGSNPFVPVDESSKLLDIFTDFSVKGLHRAPIINSHGKVIALLAQSDLVSWLADNVTTLKEVIGDKTVKDFNLGGMGQESISQVLTIKEDHSLLSALSLIDKFNIRVPVVDNDNKLVGMVSVKDLKFLMEKDLDYVIVDIKTFFSKFTGKRPPLVTCTATTPFLDVLKKMCDTKVHRVVVVDQHNKPIDIITMSNVIDVISFLATGAHRR